MKSPFIVIALPGMQGKTTALPHGPQAAVEACTIQEGTAVAAQGAALSVAFFRRAIPHA